MMKLHLGCGKNILGDDWINIDMDSKSDILPQNGLDPTSYPSIPVFNYDIFALPFKDACASEILCESVAEHLSFDEEKKLFLEIRRLLAPGGTVNIFVPDFEAQIKIWLEADENFQDFYEVGFRDDAHWFGQYKKDFTSRWGYLTATLFGHQNGKGQFHRNAYTEGKLRAIFDKLGLEVIELTRNTHKDGLCPYLRIIGRR